MKAPHHPVYTLAQVDAALPQTQCTRCGEPDCHGYAEAILLNEAGYVCEGTGENIFVVKDGTMRTAVLNRPGLSAV